MISSVLSELFHCFESASGRWPSFSESASGQLRKNWRSDLDENAYVASLTYPADDLLVYFVKFYQVL